MQFETVLIRSTESFTEMWSFFILKDLLSWVEHPDTSVGKVFGSNLSADRRVQTGSQKEKEHFTQVECSFSFCPSTLTFALSFRFFSFQCEFWERNPCSKNESNFPLLRGIKGEDKNKSSEAIDFIVSSWRIKSFESYWVSDKFLSRNLKYQFKFLCSIKTLFNNKCSPRI